MMQSAVMHAQIWLKMQIIPSSLCDDHFCAECVEFLPQFSANQFGRNGLSGSILLTFAWSSWMAVCSRWSWWEHWRLWFWRPFVMTRNQLTNRECTGSNGKAVAVVFHGHFAAVAWRILFATTSGHPTFCRLYYRFVIIVAVAAQSKRPSDNPFRNCLCGMHYVCFHRQRPSW